MNKLCFALDGINTLSEIEEYIDDLSPYFSTFKVGMESFNIFGTDIIKLIKNKNKAVFLDLKYHDIPATVRGAVYRATLQKVDIVNIHALGGSEMMQAAYDGAKKGANENGGHRPKLIAVTILTSHSEDSLKELSIFRNLKEVVKDLAILSTKNNMDGIVCSANDISFFKESMPENFYYITPGIRPSGTDSGDQKRVMTPKEAVAVGSSLLVIGRPIRNTNSREQRIQVAKEIYEEIDAL